MHPCWRPPRVSATCTTTDGLSSPLAIHLHSPLGRNAAHSISACASLHSNIPSSGPDKLLLVALTAPPCVLPCAFLQFRPRLWRVPARQQRRYRQPRTAGRPHVRRGRCPSQGPSGHHSDERVLGVPAHVCHHHTRPHHRLHCGQVRRGDTTLIQKPSSLSDHLPPLPHVERPSPPTCRLCWRHLRCFCALQGESQCAHDLRRPVAPGGVLPHGSHGVAPHWPHQGLGGTGLCR